MLNEIFDTSRINLDLESTTKTGVFTELIGTIALPDSDFNRQELFDAVILRESKMNTNILPGIAVPHGYCKIDKGAVGAIGFSREGIQYDSGSRNLVHLFFMLLMDEKSREKDLYILSRLLALLDSEAFAGIRNAKTPSDVYDVLSGF